MNIMIVTQEDALYIPRLIAGLMPERRGDIVGVTILPGETATRNIGKYLRFMGPVDFSRQVLRYGWYGLLNRLFPRGIHGRFHSVAAVARRYSIPVLKPTNVNDRGYLDQLRAMDVELVLSVAAPQIFREEILSLPRYGCINIHNGLLPRYQGLLPSFWVLANGEEYTGTTVHYMNQEIDAGEIILQEKFKIEEDDTLHSLVYRTKITMGPRLLLRALSLIEAGDVEKVEVDWSQATYYGFPDRGAVRRFRELGRAFR